MKYHNILQTLKLWKNTKRSTHDAGVAKTNIWINLLLCAAQINHNISRIQFIDDSGNNHISNLNTPQESFIAIVKLKQHQFWRSFKIISSLITNYTEQFQV